MEPYQIVFWIMILVMFVIVPSIFYLINKINKGKVPERKERIAGIILFLISISCGIGGISATILYDISKKTLPIMFSIFFFGLSIFSLIMAFGKTKEVRKDQY